MGRNILAVIAGLVVGGIVIMLLEMPGMLVHPTPDGFDKTDREAFSRHVAAAPAVAMLLVVFAHAAGTLAGAWLAAKISRANGLTQAMIVGAIFLVAGAVNLFLVPGHPAWFAVADLGVYLPAAYLGGRLGRARTAT